ncbi:hypothetical protein PAECIP111893_01377 [Paenibacillus plantiphilus]|uniref:DUF423 domain-containing protein n=1 Tax=Paenibacillus plantiphilus TaxID=2905650 RepID=A0ABM9C1L9_9BACL|nr:DUF423 domain-containing protein [Paenibacillus plantiphilus]CAH1200435.1 hypothetical protein PAECIP111893_01377 [Paenibacillus plantiphilus]
MLSKFGFFGAIHALLAVALGAFGAHALKERLDADMLAVFETGVRYHMYHAIGLVLIALLADRLGAKPALQWAGRLMHIGIFLFSGSLYVLSMSGIKVLGAITPLGGVAFITAWALAAYCLWKAGRRS